MKIHIKYKQYIRYSVKLYYYDKYLFLIQINLFIRKFKMALWQDLKL